MIWGRELVGLFILNSFFFFFGREGGMTNAQKEFLIELMIVYLELGIKKVTY